MSILQSEYWNPALETLSRDELKTIELKNFKAHMAWSKENSPLIAAKLKGIEAGDIKDFSDILRLPMIEKEDLRLAQEEPRRPEPTLYGDLLGVPITEVSHYRQTSGTTGKPVYVPESFESWQWRIEVWCHILWMAGYRPTDRVFIPFGYNVYVAFWEGHYAAEKLGCEVIPGGALDTKGRVNKILEVQPTALLNTPTYGLHLAESAKAMGLDPRQLGIRRMVCAGEPLPPATRKILEDTWAAEVYDHIGGTEPCAWAAMCSAREGLHIMEPFFLVEILDLETESRLVEEGELGVAVVTPLGRRSFPLIRFNTKDVVRRGPDSCSCGRGSMRISEVSGRTDHLTKIRGVLFSPVTVEEVVRGEFGEIAEYEVRVVKEGLMDEISLIFEPQSELAAEESAILAKNLGQRLKFKTNLRFNISAVAPGGLPRYTLKAQRFKDLRHEK